MNVDTTLEANAQLAKGSQPGMRALDYPAMTPKPVIALDATPRDMRSLRRWGVATRTVIAFVSMRLAGQTSGSATTASYRRRGTNQLLEHHRLIPVGACDAEDQQDTLSIRDDGALAAEFSPVRRIGSDVLAPRGLATLVASTLARPGSSLPVLRNSASNYRLQVMPHPCCLPVTQTSPAGHAAAKARFLGKLFPWDAGEQHKDDGVGAISSLARGQKPLSDGTTCGDSGSILRHSAVPISLFLFRDPYTVKRIYGVRRWHVLLTNFREMRHAHTVHHDRRFAAPHGIRRSGTRVHRRERAAANLRRI